MSGTSTAVLPSAAHSACARARGVLAGRGREGELDERHLRHRVEDVQADEALGAAARGARAAATDSDEVVVARTRPGAEDRGQLGEQRGLGVVLLDDRLDDERRVGQCVEVAATVAAVHGSTASSSSQSRALRRREVSERAHRTTWPVTGRDGGQAARDRAAARRCPSRSRRSGVLGLTGSRLVQSTVRAYDSRTVIEHDMQHGREVVIVEAVRTPIGRGHPEKGYYKDTHPNELLGKCYTEVIERAGIDAAEVEDVIGGCVQQYGEQMFNVGAQRLAAGRAADRDARPRRSTASAARPSRPSTSRAALIAAGVHDVVIGGGRRAHGPHPDGRRLQLDRRGRLAVAARADGAATTSSPQGLVGRDDRRQVGDPPLRARRARRALAPARPPGDRGGPLRARDRSRSRSTATPTSPTRASGPDTNLETLSQLKPAFKPDGKITAGNSSQISDGAAAVLLMSADKAKELGLTPRARIVDQTTVGVDPVIMLTGPIPATRKLLERNGMTIDDIDLFEINEAFAPGRRRVAARARARHGPRQRQRRRDGARPPARLDRRAAASPRCCTSSSAPTRRPAS